MTTSSVIWTVHPRQFYPGAAGKISLELAVLVAPTLSGATGPGDLGEFRDWPTVVARLLPDKGTFVTANGQLVMCRVASRDDLSSQLWSAIFRDDIPIITPSAPVPSTPRSFDAYAAAAAIRSRYAARARGLRLDDAGSASVDSVTGYYEPRAGDGPAPAAATLDFHGVVSYLANYPELLIRLGLVVRLVVDDASSIASGGPAGKIALAINNRPADHLPITGYRILGNRMFPEPGTQIEQGFLVMDDFHLDDMDIEGYQMKVKAKPASPQSAWDDDSEEADDPDADPSHRSAGVSLYEKSRPNAVHQRRLRGSKIRGVSGVHGDHVNADDTRRGYRPDIWDDTTRCWYSLTSREGTYSFHGHDTLAGVLDEGVEVPSGSKPSATDDQVHPAVLRWSGWSLAVSRPGKPVVDGGGHVNVSGGGYRPWRSIEFQVPRPSAGVQQTQLPRLRFGRLYALRARAVDQTGYSLPPSPAPETDAVSAPLYDAAGKLQDGRYWRRIQVLRHEPVGPPVVAARVDTSAFGSGETPRRVVMRDGLSEFPDRHVLPPGTTEQLAEMHGAFEVVFARHSHDDPLGHTYDVAARVDHPIPKYDPGASVEVPYLVDPFGFSVAVNMQFPSAPTQRAIVVFGDPAAWPEATSFRVVMLDGNDAPATWLWDPADRALRVSLPRGTQCLITLAHTLTPDELSVMAPARWVEQHRVMDGTEHSTAASLETYRARAIAGRESQLTPPSRLRLVHAVKLPRSVPAWPVDFHILPRPGGSTSVQLSTLLDRVHVESTGRVAVEAQWQDVIDDVQKDAPYQRPVTATIGHHDIGLRDAGVALSLPHEVGDTRARLVGYTAVATSRFREFFPEEDPAHLVVRSAAVLCAIPSSVKPGAPRVRSILPLMSFVRQDGASTRKGRALRVWLERPWFSSGNGELLAVVLGDPAISDPPVSKWGIDPLWLTRETLANLSVSDLPGAAFSAVVDVSNGPGSPSVKLTVAVFEPQFADGAWFVDLQIDPPDGVRAQMVNRFIRLALARYQQNSIPGCSLSPIVLADFSQLLNDRCVTVQDSHNGQYSVSVSGPAEDRGAASSNPAGSPQRVFMVTPEVMTSYDGPWMPSGESTSLAPAPSQEHDPPALGRWVGQVIVGTSAYQRRLLIREYEVYPNSVGAAPVAPSSEPGIGGRGYRLVFAEAVSI